MGTMVRERAGVFAAFFVVGVVGATWAARLPATGERLHVGSGGLAIAGLGIEGGALLGLPFGAMLLSRHGARRSIRVGLLVFVLLLPPLALVPTLSTLVPLLAVWAGANSLVDIAVNAAGVEIEARSGRRALATLHAGQTVGLLVGGGIATAATAAGAPVTLHFAVVGIGGAVAAVAVTRAVPGDGRQANVLRIGFDRRLVTLGALAACALLVEASASYWVAVDFRSEHGTSPAFAAFGYTTTVLAIAVVRLAADGFAGRWSAVRLTQVCGVVVGCGALLVVLVPATGGAVAGWLLVGGGVALVVPAAMRAAGNGPAIAAVSTCGYVGSFVGPPTIGAVAEATGLSSALGLLTVAAVGMVMLARRAYAGGGP